MEFKLEIYAPDTEVVAIRDALNSVGAGVVGDYDSVISIVKIQGSGDQLKARNLLLARRVKLILVKRSDLTLDAKSL